MKRLFLLPLLILAGACAVPEVPEQKPEPAAEKTQEGELAYDSLLTFIKAMEQTRAAYVDPEKVSYENLLQGALKGMLHQLDPYSNYENPTEYKLMMDDSRGKFAGIGATVRAGEKGVVIVRTIPGKPAAKAGIRKGDILLSADGVVLKGKTIEESMDYLRGNPGSRVIFKVQREGVPEKEYIVTREEIETPSIANQGILFERTGYLRIDQFTETTHKELADFLKANQGKLDGLIIDLRFNPGGLLISAVKSLSLFLETGKPLVSVEGRSEEKAIHSAEKSEKYPDLPIVILVNEYSASAAEIFAGCMQDYKRAVLVGMKTFGKGSVQSVIPLPNGGALRLTIAKYYTPSRRLIHGNGIPPDVKVEMTEDEIKAVTEYFLDHENTVPLYEEEYEDKQLSRAAEIMKGIQIYKAAEKQK